MSQLSELLCINNLLTVFAVFPCDNNAHLVAESIHYYLLHTSLVKIDPDDVDNEVDADINDINKLSNVTSKFLTAR